MFKQVLDGDESLAVVVEVVEDESHSGGGVEPVIVVGLHEGHVDADGLSKEPEVEFHVHSNSWREEAVLGAQRTVGFLEEGGIVGGDAQYAPSEYAIVYGVLNGVLGIAPVVCAEGQLGQQQESDYKSHN